MPAPSTPPPSKEEIEIFSESIDMYRYDFTKLVYIIFPFGQKGHPLENMKPYDWQHEEWAKISKHLMNPETRYDAYRLIISSGNGAAKTAFGAMTMIMLLYTQRLRARVTANTQPQLNSIVWPEVDIWFRHAMYNEHFFEKFGTSIKSRNLKIADSWRVDAVTWSEHSPASISGLHNKGGAILYYFEEAPGIPAVVWQYAAGAFTETETIKFFMAFGNSDDPESKFEQNMESPLWHARRIDTRELSHIDQGQIKDWLMESGGDEDADDFRVRVRGLPRKTAKDSIIRLESVQGALGRSNDFDTNSIKMLPVILSCDPAWTGGDECTIWYRQGPYCKLLEKYKLDKSAGETHQMTYDKLCYWERILGADQVNIDQGEGTAIYTLAMNAEKDHWELISFANQANDALDARDSEYGNIRAQMYYTAQKHLQKGGVLDSKEEKWIPEITKQLCWTKGTRHKITGKKMAEPKLDIKTRIGQSPDVADGFVLLFARDVTDRLPENEGGSEGSRNIGGGSFQMPEHPSPYGAVDAYFEDIYD